MTIHREDSVLLEEARVGQTRKGHSETQPFPDRAAREEDSEEDSAAQAVEALEGEGEAVVAGARGSGVALNGALRGSRR